MAYKRISPTPVVEGGTGAQTLTGVITGNGTSAMTANAVTQYSVLVGGASNAVSNVSGVGTSGQVLTSNGAGANPTFQDSSGDVTGPGSSTDNALARWNGTGGDTLQDSTVLVSDNGEMTNASQPAFLAYLGTTDANQTGNGTVYTLGSGNALTEVYDQNSDFNTNGTFTAPLTGRYLLSFKCSVIGLTTYEVTRIQIITSNRTYTQLWTLAVAAGGGTSSQSFSILADMDTSDTATYTIQITGNGSDAGDIQGSSELRNAVSGALIC